MEVTDDKSLPKEERKRRQIETAPKKSILLGLTCGLQPSTCASLAPLLLYLCWKPHMNAMLISAVLNAQRGRSNIVLLTQIGGGAFGNDAGRNASSSEVGGRLGAHRQACEL